MYGSPRQTDLLVIEAAVVKSRVKRPVLPQKNQKVRDGEGW